jgi:hypothetical protein
MSDYVRKNTIFLKIIIRGERFDLKTLEERV